MGRLSKNRGRSAEQGVTKYLGPPWIRRRFRSEDLGHPEWSGEVKSREALPKSIMGWWNQCLASAEKGGKHPVLFMRQQRMKYPDTLVCITLKRFKELTDDYDNYDNPGN